MNSKGQLLVKFHERTAFGKFCLAVADADVPYTMAGSQTIVLAETQSAVAKSDRLC